MLAQQHLCRFCEPVSTVALAVAAAICIVLHGTQESANQGLSNFKNVWGLEGFLPS